MNRSIPFLMCLLALLLTACSGGGEGGGNGTAAADEGILPDSYPPAPEGVFRVNVKSEPPDLDPSHAADIPSIQVISHLFEPLARMDGAGVMQPANAREWSHNDDYTEWIFRLREDAVWNNGDPVTADDYVFAIERLLTPATAAPMAMMVYQFLEGGEEFFDAAGALENVSGLEATDDHTLVVRLKSPAPFFPTLVQHPAWYPLHRATIEEHGEQWSRSPETYVSNGPFRLQEIRPKSRIIAVKSDSYAEADEVHFEEIHFLFIENNQTEIAAFAAGDLDMSALIPNREAAELMQEPEFRNDPMIGTYFVTFNMTQPPFNDRALRKAFQLAINRERIVKQIVRRGELPAVGLIPHGMILPDGSDYRDVAPPMIPQDFEANVEEAKRLLAEAGYGEGGKPLPRIEYVYNKTDLHDDIGQALQTFWKAALDADVDLQKVEWGVLLDRIQGKEFTAARSAWIGDYMDPLTFLEIFQTGHAKNGAGYSNPEYDAIVDRIRLETDPEKRLELIVEAERMVVEEDAIIAPIYEYSTPVLVRTNIEGVVRAPLSGLDASRARRI